jgi:hypothetical protein
VSIVDPRNTMIVLDSLIISLFGASCFVVLLGLLKAQLYDCSLLSDYFNTLCSVSLVIKTAEMKAN